MHEKSRSFLVGFALVFLGLLPKSFFFTSREDFQGDSYFGTRGFFLPEWGLLFAQVTVWVSSEGLFPPSSGFLRSLFKNPVFGAEQVFLSPEVTSKSKFHTLRIFFHHPFVFYSILCVLKGRPTPHPPHFGLTGLYLSSSPSPSFFDKFRLIFCVPMVYPFSAIHPSHFQFTIPVFGDFPLLPFLRTSPLKRYLLGRPEFQSAPPS